MAEFLQTNVTKLLALGVDDLVIPFGLQVLPLSSSPLDRAAIGLEIVVALQSTRRFEQAFRLASQALEWAVDSPRLQWKSCFALAMISMDLGRLEQALEYAEQSLTAAEAETDPGKRDEAVERALMAKALVLDEMGKLDKALEVHRLTPDAQKPSSVEQLVRNGRWLIREGQAMEAEQVLREAVRLIDPADPINLITTLRRPYELLAGLLEAKGTQEASQEAAELRKVVAWKERADEELRAAALEEVRAIAAREQGGVVRRASRRKGKQKKGRKKGRKGKQKGKGKKAGGAGGARSGAGAAAAGGSPDLRLEGQDGGEGGGEKGGEGQQVEEEDDEEAEEEEEVEDECSICMKVMGDEEEAETRTIGILQCHHRFHNTCLDMWAGVCARKHIDPTCPLCRQPLVRAVVG